MVETNGTPRAILLIQRDAAQRQISRKEKYLEYLREQINSTQRTIDQYQVRIQEINHSLDALD